jgi:hypothetical protein
MQLPLAHHRLQRPQGNLEEARGRFRRQDFIGEAGSG